MRRAAATIILISAVCLLGGAVPAWAAPGDPLWSDRYDGPSPELDDQDYARDVVVGENGFVYVTGTTESPDTGNDLRTVAYSPTGDRLWTARYDGPTSGFDAGEAIAFDAIRNRVYVTGTSFSATDSDYTTVAYDAQDGSQLWTKRYVGPGGPGGATDSAADIAVDLTTGTVTVTGSSAGANGTLDYATVSYLPSGARRWVARYTSPGRLEDRASALAIGSDGAAYITGTSRNTTTGIESSTTLAYAADRSLLWSVREAGPGSTSGAAIVVDNARSTVSVTGNRSTGPAYDFYTRAWTTAGAPLWSAVYGDTSGEPDTAVDIALAPDTGAVTVTGQSRRSVSYDFQTISYSTTGSRLWLARYAGGGQGGNPAAVAVDPTDGTVYVTGQSFLDSRDDAVTVAYSSTGIQIWVRRVRTQDAFGAPIGIAVDPGNGHIYVAGYVYNATDGLIWSTIAYAGR